MPMCHAAAIDSTLVDRRVAEVDAGVGVGAVAGDGCAWTSVLWVQTKVAGGDVVVVGFVVADGDVDVVAMCCLIRMLLVGGCDAVDFWVDAALSGSWASIDSICTNRCMTHRMPVVVVAADIVAVVVVAVGGNDYFACVTMWPKREFRLCVHGCLCSDRNRRCCASTNDCAHARNSVTSKREESSVVRSRWLRLLMVLVFVGPTDASTDLWCCVRLCVGSLVAALAAFVSPFLRIGVFSMAMLPYCCCLIWQHHPKSLEVLAGPVVGLECCCDSAAVVPPFPDVDSRRRVG